MCVILQWACPREGLVGGTLLGMGGASPAVESRLDGDGGAGRAAHRQEVSVAGLLCVVPQHFGQVTLEKETPWQRLAR